MSANADAMTNAQGEFQNHVPRSEPMVKGGHKPGVKVGNDAAPEFHAQTLPAGSAPQDRSFVPNTTSEIPGQAMNPNIAKETWTNAESTLNGATSADVHTGYGHPGQGQTANDLTSDGKARGERSGADIAGGNQTNSFRKRALDIDAPTGVRGKSGANRDQISGAEERVPESAETLASEFP